MCYDVLNELDRVHLVDGVIEQVDGLNSKGSF